MDGDSNRAKKAHSRQLESFAIGTKRKLVDDPVINFGLSDLEGVTIPHDDALVVQATITNYKVARVFVDLGSSVNILFKEDYDWI